MALVLNDRVRETTTIVGTGTATLLGAAAGYQSFSVIGNANTCYYTISDQAGTNWEVGIGTYVSATPALARTTVLKSSNAGALVSFPAGTKDVFVTYPAETAVSGGGGGTYPTIQPTLNLDFANTKQLDPRITFVRNSTAAYYDGQTTAMAEQNLLIGSQTIGGTGWNLGSNIVTLNSTTAPDNTTTASSITENATVNSHFIGSAGVTVTTGLPYTFSVYLKKGVGATAPQYMQFYAFSAAFNCGINVDLNAGTVYSTTSVAATITSSSSVSMGNGWYRFIFTATALFSSTSANIPAVVFINNTPASGAAPSYLGLVTSDVQAWGAQLEQRSSATAYTPTTTTAITNYIPVLMTAPAGVARFDCDPITGKSLGLLIEESRVNLLTYSSDFSNAIWVLEGGALKTPNTIIAPDGSLTGCKLYSDATTAIHTLRQQVTTTAISYAYYIYAKAGEKRRIVLRDNTVGREGVFDLISGVVISSSGGFGSISSVGNGWYRCSIVGTLAAANTRLQIVVAGDTATSYATSAFLGNGYSGIYIWGAQLEAGSFATSYIPTVASTVTRAADPSSMVSTNFSSWYNQAQGTFVVEADAYSTGSGAAIFTVRQGVSQNYIASLFKSDQQPSVYVNGVLSANLTPGTQIANTFGKLAWSQNETVFTSSLNGRTPVTATSTARIPTMDTLYIGSFGTSTPALNGHIRKLSYYPVALSSNNLVALTS